VCKRLKGELIKRDILIGNNFVPDESLQSAEFRASAVNATEESHGIHARAASTPVLLWFVVQWSLELVRPLAESCGTTVALITCGECSTCS
jgi:hypothetical protein